MGWNWAEIRLKCSTGFVYCLWKNFWNQNWFWTLQAFIWYHKHWDWISLRCSRGKKLFKNGPELSWNLFTVLYRLCLLSMKKFWSQNWFGTLQAFIWYHKHWDLIIGNCSRGRKLLKNGPELGWNLFTVLCRLCFLFMEELF